VNLKLATQSERLRIAANEILAVADELEGVVPPPTPSRRYFRLVGFASIGFVHNTNPAAVLTTPAQVATALSTPGSAFRLGGDVQLARSVKVASGVFCDLGGFRLTSAGLNIVEFGTYGTPSAAVTDSAIVNGIIGPSGGDGVRIYSGSTRIWLDGINFEGPYYDEAMTIGHAPEESPKSQMRISITNTRWTNMPRAAGGAEYGLLIGDGSYANSEIGDWANTLRREPPIQVTLYNFEFNDVWLRCPLVYSSWLHAKNGRVVHWNHPDGGSPACDTYGAAEVQIENVTYDKAGSSTRGAAIQCNSQYGYLPRLSENGNTYLGDYPSGSVVRNGAPPTVLEPPYSLS
jgi:hypothetical protein